MKEVIDFCFKNRQDKYIAVTKYDATWVNNINSHNTSIGKESQKLADHLFIRSVFFQCWKLAFRRTMGIAMGSDLNLLWPACFFSHMNLNGFCKLRGESYGKLENLPTHFAL